MSAQMVIKNTQKSKGQKGIESTIDIDEVFPSKTKRQFAMDYSLEVFFSSFNDAISSP